MKKELEELLKLSHKRNFNLQLFADDGGEGGQVELTILKINQVMMKKKIKNTLMKM